MSPIQKCVSEIIMCTSLLILSEYSATYRLSCAMAPTHSTVNTEGPHGPGRTNAVPARRPAQQILGNSVNGSICRVQRRGSGSCTYPKDFLGSKDSSVPTPLALPPPPAQQVFNNSNHDINEWWVPVGIVVAIVLSVCGVTGLALSFYKLRTSKLSQIRFQQLRHVQKNEGEYFYTDGEEDPFIDQKRGNGQEFF